LVGLTRATEKEALPNEQALVPLKIKETFDAEVGRTKAVIIEGG